MHRTRCSISMFVLAFALMSSSLTAEDTGVGTNATPRRRAVARLGPFTPPPSTGDCVTFPNVKPGLETTYQSTDAQGTHTVVITYLSDSLVQTVTKSVAPGPSGNTTTDTTTDWETVQSPPFRAVKKIVTKTLAPSPIGNISIDTSTTFVPSLVIAPAGDFCAGAVWTVPATTQTSTIVSSITGTSNQVAVSQQGEGKVVAVNLSVTVPAGTFNTVLYEGFLTTGSATSLARTWTSTVHSIMVKQEVFDPVTMVMSTSWVLTGLK